MSNRRTGAVGVAVRLAQVLIQPRRERSAEDRCSARRARSSPASIAPRRPSRCGSATAPRPACRRDRSAARRAARAAASAGLRRRRAVLPAAERLFELRQHASRRHVADDEQVRVLRLVDTPCRTPQIVRSGHLAVRRVVAHRRACRSDVAARRPAARTRPPRAPDGLSRVCSRLVSRSLRSRSSSVWRERRPQRHVRHQRQRLVELRHRRVQPDVDESNELPVPSDAPRKSTASASSSAFSRAGALVEHRGREARQRRTCPAGSAAAPALTISDRFDDAALRASRRSRPAARWPACASESAAASAPAPARAPAPSMRSGRLLRRATAVVKRDQPADSQSRTRELRDP